MLGIVERLHAFGTPGSSRQGFKGAVFTHGAQRYTARRD
jgi:hypothetical protein